MTSPRDKDPKRDDADRTLASPYGPQYGHVDEAAGGADSSPYETEPSGEKGAAAEEAEKEKAAKRL
jgi:hypothetical protein